jgi:hypothetical protein
VFKKLKDYLNKKSSAIARLHFHPDVTEEEIRQRINIQNLEFKIRPERSPCDAKL